MIPTSASRRKFIRTTALAGLGSSMLLDNPLLANAESSSTGKEANLNFLFQGDSITDGNRGRDNDPNHIMGHGYAFSIASRVGAAFPAKHNQFYNRGVSGNKITDLEKRWQADTLNLKPDVLSILVGINDADSVVKHQDIVTPEKYEGVYRSLLQQTTKQFPDIILVLCEPFILPVGRVKDNWKNWTDDVQQRQAIVKNLANEFNAVFVPLQQIFTDAAKVANPDYWIWDGIHPTYSGHELITKEWLKQVGQQLHFLRTICA